MLASVITIEPGDGKTYPTSGDKVVMHYVAYLAETGVKFDSSYERSIPFRFQVGVGQAIKGWDEGVQRMTLGEKATLKIPSEYAYGVRGAGGSIPANTDLIFEVEIIAISNY